MPERDPTPKSAAQSFSRDVGAQENRKLRSARTHPHVWSGLGMLGLIGWSVCLPTMLGAWLGLWLDARRPGTHRWVLVLLVAGLCVGCATAWHWINREEHAIQRGQGDDE
ncbi:MAG TPA: AtpZ/AtpI family protein [Steroidobacteraceae bacterium]